MKKIIFATIALGALVASASCQKEEAFAPSQKLTITLNDDFFTDEDGSKVTLDGKKFSWETTDQVGVVGTDKYTNLAPLTNDGNCQTFSGTVPGEAVGTEYYVVYPYAAQVTKKNDTGKRITDIPFSPYQTAVKGGLPLITYNLTEGMAGKPAIVLIGTTTDNGTKATLKCQNALLKFKFTSSDIKEVHFTMSSPCLAGDRVWYYTETASSKIAGTIYPQDGCCETQTIVVKPASGCFEAGEYYYAAITPANYKLAFRAFCASSNKNYSKTQGANFNFEAGKVYTLGQDGKGLDELGKSEDPVNVEGNAITFDFTNGTVYKRNTTDTPIPDFATATTTFDCCVTGLNTSWYMNINSNKGLGLDGGFLKLGTSGNPYFSIPPITGYTIKSADIEFAEQPDNVYVYWGKGAAPASNNTLNAEKVQVVDCKATVTTQMCTSYCRYYLRLCRKTSSGYSSINEDVKIKSVTFHYEYGSWPGSWN